VCELASIRVDAAAILLFHEGEVKKKKKRKKTQEKEIGEGKKAPLSFSLLFVRVEPPTLWLSGRFTALKFPFFGL
jgi:hypothetical protein